MSEGHEFSFNDFASQISADLTKLVKESYKAPATFMEHMAAFKAAVDWSEPWIKGLMVFHLVMLLVFLRLKNNEDAQTGIFMVLCALVMFSERINGICAANWRSFSTQNYFDERGTFAVTMWSGPLLSILFFQLLNFLRLASSALIKAKRLELASKRNKTKAGDAGEEEVEKVEKVAKVAKKKETKKNK